MHPRHPRPEKTGLHVSAAKIRLSITFLLFFTHKTYILQQSKISKVKIGFGENVFNLTSWTDIGMHILYSFKSIAV